MTQAQAFITGIGHHLPERVVRNEDLPPPLNADPAGITKRTGIEERRWVTGRTYTSDIAALASHAALADAGLELRDVDCLIAATLSPNHCFPGLGVYTQAKMGLARIPAYDVRNQCSGFLYALNVARAFVIAGIHKKVLVACAEVHSHGLGKTAQHAHITPLFGDGAASVVVTGEPHPERLSFAVDYVKVYADGTGADRLRQRVWDSSIEPFMDWKQVADSSETMWYAEMDGQFIFRRAVDGMAKASREALEACGLTLDDIAYFLPHQANLNISKTVASVLKLPPEKLLSNIHRVGNTTAASIPLLLSETVQAGKVKKGDRIVVAAFGSGLTWGAGILRAL